MTNKDIENSISYCGLICNFCFQGDKCKGCRSTNSVCDFDLSDTGCYQKQCCLQKGFDGCWQCDVLDTCVSGIYSLGDFSKIKAFALYIKENGKQDFIARIIKNREKGLSVEKGKDYDNKTISEVMEMILSATV